MVEARYTFETPSFHRPEIVRESDERLDGSPTWHCLAWGYKGGGYYGVRPSIIIVDAVVEDEALIGIIQYLCSTYSWDSSLGVASVISGEAVCPSCGPRSHGSEHGICWVGNRRRRTSFSIMICFRRIMVYCYYYYYYYYYSYYLPHTIQIEISPLSIKRPKRVLVESISFGPITGIRAIGRLP